jgi:sodium-dependent dicarboxylate transporter 2/3/5
MQASAETGPSAAQDPSLEIDEGPVGAARVGRVLGPLLAAGAVALAHPGGGGAGGFTADQAWVLGLLLWMATWWVTLAVDPAVTGLLPVVVLSALGIGKPAQIAGPYADDVMFLFAGGSLLALALESTGVSERFARGLVRLAGRSPLMVLAAVMTAAALISAFVSNLATAATLLPLALALGARATRDAQGTALAPAAGRFATSLLLGVAFGSSIGGAMTPVGSPPNPIAIEWLNDNGVPMDFTRWVSFAVPTTLVFLPLAIVVLGVWLFPARGLVIRQDGRAAGAPLGRDAWCTVAVFAATVAAWVTLKQLKSVLPGMSDGSIAVAAATLLFLLPSATRPGRGILGPSAFGRIPWRVLVLFGGGLALAEAMKGTGLSARLGEIFHAAGAMPSIAVLAVVVAVLVFASEVASNTALSAMAVPIVGALAPAIGVPPEALVIPAVFAASWAFAMPVGTPPNALVFASGALRAQDMMRAGLVLDVLAIAVIVTMATILL